MSNHVDSLPKRRLGKTNLMVTTLGFGGIPIQRVSEEKAIEVVRKAFDLGINFFDTARAYTTSEERIGKALQGREYIVATKSGVRDAQSVYDEICCSLQNLRRDYIDLHQLHGVNDNNELDKVLAAGGALEGQLRAKEEGKILHIGITGHRIETLVKAVEICRDFESVQVPYNPVEDALNETLMPECEKRDIGLIAMKPAGGGNFSNPALSVKWCLTQAISTAIPGMETIEEVQENVALAAQEVVLSATEEAEIERMKSELGQRTCRRCGYCEPCPNGVRIFLLLNGRAIMKRMSTQRYKEWGAREAIDGAANCVECNICVSKCPYSLPIPELIKEAVEYYETIPELK